MVTESDSSDKGDTVTGTSVTVTIPLSQTTTTPTNHHTQSRRLRLTSATDIWRQNGWGDWRDCTVTPTSEGT